MIGDTDRFALWTPAPNAMPPASALGCRALRVVPRGARRLVIAAEHLRRRVEAVGPDNSSQFAVDAYLPEICWVAQRLAERPT